MGRPLKTINEIIQGKARITPETALQLEKVLGTPASFWNNAERNYREGLARQELHKRYHSQLEWLQDIPVREMIKWNWIRAYNEPARQVEEVLHFFGVASSDAWQDFWKLNFEKRLAVEFRKSEAFECSWAALAAWLRKGEIEAQKIKCAKFDEHRFRKALNEIRSLTVKPPPAFQSRFMKLCSERTADGWSGFLRQVTLPR